MSEFRFDPADAVTAVGFDAREVWSEHDLVVGRPDARN
jgi:hypothetical protein